MSEIHDPIPGEDAVAFLLRRTPLERHAIARLLGTDGPPLALLDWIVDQPDCDRATAAMIFWRLRTLPAAPDDEFDFDPAMRNAVLKKIAAKVEADLFTAARIAWDGREAWDGTALIGASPLPAISDFALAARDLSGPFGDAWPEAAACAFLDESYEEDDMFDDLWRVSPDLAAAADWLADKPAEVWMAAVDALLPEQGKVRVIVTIFGRVTEPVVQVQGDRSIPVDVQRNISHGSRRIPAEPDPELLRRRRPLTDDKELTGRRLGRIEVE